MRTKEVTLYSFVAIRDHYRQFVLDNVNMSEADRRNAYAEQYGIAIIRRKRKWDARVEYCFFFIRDENEVSWLLSNPDKICLLEVFSSEEPFEL